MDKKDTAKDQTVGDTSARKGPTLLTLPPEIRYIIFRHLLLPPIPVRFDKQPEFTKYLAFRNHLAILRTNRLINREASKVFYGENIFKHNLWDPMGRSMIMSFSRRNLDMIQNIKLTLVLSFVPVETAFRNAEVIFEKFVQDFGNQSIVRSTLTVAFWFERYFLPMMPPFTRGLGQLTHFRTIEVIFWDDHSSLQHSPLTDYRDPRSIITEINDYIRTALEPMLGPAEDFGPAIDFPPAEDYMGDKLKLFRFHPWEFSRAQQNACQEDDHFFSSS